MAQLPQAEHRLDEQSSTDHAAILQISVVPPGGVEPALGQSRAKPDILNKLKWSEWPRNGLQISSFE